MFFELIIRGFAVGLIYALMGLSLTLIFGVMRIITFAQGEFYMIGGYAAYYLFVLFGLPFYVAIPGAMGLTFIVGAAVEKLLLSPIHYKKLENPMEYALIITFGLCIFFRKGASLIFGPYYRKVPDSISGDVSLAGINISADTILTVLASAFLVLGTACYVQKTWRGRIWRAITQTIEGAKITGVNVHRESCIAFGSACALAAAAGALVSPLYMLHPTSGAIPLVKAYEIIAIGGLGSIGGSFIGGIVLGLSETLGAVYISSAYKDAIGFILLTLFLIFRPRGLFGQQ